MKLTEDGKNFIKGWESLKLKAYKCSSGRWTISWGVTHNVSEGDQISEKEAEQMFLKALAPFEAGITAMVKVPLSQHEFTALVSLAYNVGLNSVATSRLIKKLNMGDREGAAEEFSIGWDTSNGERVLGLIRRREAERNLFSETQ